jgi:hypothetical protein
MAKPKTRGPQSKGRKKSARATEVEKLGKSWSTKRRSSKRRSPQRRASSARKAWVPWTWATGRTTPYPVPPGGQPCHKRVRKVSSRGCDASGRRPLRRSKSRVGAREMRGLLL